MPKSRMQEFLELLDDFEAGVFANAVGDMRYEKREERRSRLITFIEKEFENRTSSR